MSDKHEELKQRAISIVNGAPITHMDEAIEKVFALCQSAVLGEYDNASIDIDTKVRERINSHLGCDNLSDSDVLQISINASNLTRILHRKAINGLKND